jgi:hypothetical protein
VTDRHGAPLHFNAPIPKTAGVIATAPGVHRAIMARF